MNHRTCKQLLVTLLIISICLAMVGCSAQEKSGAEQAADYLSLQSVDSFNSLFHSEFNQAFGYATNGDTKKAAELYQKLYDCLEALDGETNVPTKAEEAHKELIATAVCCVRTADRLVDTAEDIHLGGNGEHGFQSAGIAFDEVKTHWRAYQAELAKLEADKD